MCQNDSRIPALIQQNRELNERFEKAVTNFWKAVNDERAQRRAQPVQSDQAGNDGQDE